ncbi:MAG: RsmB/NOP family class I SAM-dependent RNA methyltransferase [Alphaproteobacteria bacterium]|nr:RsmB/NOP family class I SAM-dependent RNA methyltransferase [Alphaproteobacteria bacterium]
MQSEQIQKAIDELWALTQDAHRPASEIINEYTRARRYIGSKDRKLITEGVWTLWRQKNYPKWLKIKIPNFDDEFKSMNSSQAPTTLRANGDREKIADALKKEGIECRLTNLSPLGLILEKRINLTTLDTFKKGLIEVQDEGSQMIGLDTGVRANETVLELCAGAGGKSLLFAQMMQGKGRIVASDISARSLAELGKRAKRANVHIIQTTLQIPNEKFDVVVIDAPCSGTGTYRRAPDNVHKLTAEQFKHLLKTQKELLEKAVAYVKPDGRICYMTCSLTQDENENQIKSFLSSHSGWQCALEKHYTPATTQTDGFYIATLKKGAV